MLPSGLPAPGAQDCDPDRGAILEIVWHLLAKGTTYHERGADYIDRRDKDHTTRRHVRLLENLGHRVTLEPIPIAA